MSAKSTSPKKSSSKNTAPAWQQISIKTAIVLLLGPLWAFFFWFSLDQTFNYLLVTQRGFGETLPLLILDVVIFVAWLGTIFMQYFLIERRQLWYSWGVQAGLFLIFFGNHWLGYVLALGVVGTLWFGHKTWRDEYQDRLTLVVFKIIRPGLNALVPILLLIVSLSYFLVLQVNNVPEREVDEISERLVERSLEIAEDRIGGFSADMTLDKFVFENSQLLGLEPGLLDPDAEVFENLTPDQRLQVEQLRQEFLQDIDFLNIAGDRTVGDTLEEYVDTKVNDLVKPYLDYFSLAIAAILFLVLFVFKRFFVYGVRISLEIVMRLLLRYKILRFKEKKVVKVEVEKLI